MKTPTPRISCLVPRASCDAPLARRMPRALCLAALAAAALASPVAGHSCTASPVAGHSCPAPFAALAADYPSEDVVISTLLPDGTTNTWTRSDLAAALGLINRKYHRETDASTGTLSHRKEWHGRLVTEIVDTNALTRTQVYEDGMTFVDPWAAKKPVTPPQPVMTNGIPARLAEARLRRQREKTTTTVIERTITAGDLY